MVHMLSPEGMGEGALPPRYSPDFSGQPVNIADLVPGLALPDYPPMPTHDSPVPMPPKTSAAA
jgi:hypothetical protein